MRWRGRVAAFAALFTLCVGILPAATDTNPAGVLSVEAATTKGVVTVSSLNVRKGPGIEYDLVTQDGKNVYLFQNDTVKIKEEKNGFYKVEFTYNNSTVIGYSDKSYIKLISTTPTPTVKPTATPASSTITIQDNSVPSAAVKSSTKTVSGLSFSGKVTASALRVRTKASTSADELVYKNKKVRLYKGDKVTISQQKIVKGVVWYYVKFTYEKKTLKGYVLSDYVKLTFAETVKGKIYSDVKIYVRNSAGVTNDYLMYEDKKVSLKDGKAVKVLKEANANSKKWFRISFSYGGQKLKGYILANLVAFQTAQTTTATPSPSPTATPKVTVNPTNTPTMVPTAIPTNGAVQTPENPTATAISEATATVNPTQTPDATKTPEVWGEVNNGPLNVRVGAGKDYDRLIYNGEYISLPIGHKVQIVKEVTGKTENWYYVKFNYNDVEMKGYVMAQYVTKINSGIG